MTDRAASAARTLAVACLALTLSGTQTRLEARELPPNIWVNLRAGGVATGNGIGDEGYNSFVYTPALRKALVFGQYHAISVSDGEDQNALLAYDFALNRWELLEVTEAAWSEFLPGVGHDQGNVAVDTLHDLYITKGNQTLHGNTAHTTYVYDLKAGRGKRMMPPVEPYIGESAASAFDPDHDLVLTTKGPSWLYDHNANVWTEVPNSPSHRMSPGLVYDTKQRVFVMFGGSDSSETWSFDAGTRVWTKRNPPVSPPGRTAPNVAFDSVNGVALLVGGHGKGGVELSDVWVYETALNRWSELPVSAPPGINPGAGNNLTYDSHHQVFLLKSTTDLRDVWAFKYVPSRVGQSLRAGNGTLTNDRPWPTPPPVILPLGFESPATAASLPIGPVDLPLRTWVARRLPPHGKGPQAGKHMRLAHNPVNGRLYLLGGDYAGLIGYDSGRNEVYSYSVADDTWVLEYPYCGPPGSVQPSHPDEVGWVYDTLRHIFWVIPGYMSAAAEDPCPQNLVLDRIMTFDPITKQWAVPNRTMSHLNGGVKFAVYDPVTDAIIRFIGSGIQHYAIASNRESVYLYDNVLQEARLTEEYGAIDPVGRVIYVIEPVQGRLYRYWIDQRRLEFVVNTPVSNPVPPGGADDYWPWNSAMPIWDSINGVLLWPRIRDFSTANITLYIYHPDTGQWEKDAMVQPNGLPVRGNTAVFDPDQNVLMVLGGTYPRNEYLFLYRYGAGPARSRTGAARP
ncbi:MAG: hypothetical protein HYS14_06945 [Candidatus Rokubacteria bacterium]|nr:hypothetical protein [Candidatus Rokubacteria bacterium]